MPSLLWRRDSERNRQRHGLDDFPIHEEHKPAAEVVLEALNPQVAWVIGGQIQPAVILPAEIDEVVRRVLARLRALDEMVGVQHAPTPTPG